MILNPSIAVTVSLIWPKCFKSRYFNLYIYIHINSEVSFSEHSFTVNEIIPFENPEFKGPKLHPKLLQKPPSNEHWARHEEKLKYFLGVGSFLCSSRSYSSCPKGNKKTTWQGRTEMMGKSSLKQPTKERLILDEKVLTVVSFASLHSSRLVVVPRGQSSPSDGSNEIALMIEVLGECYCGASTTDFCWKLRMSDVNDVYACGFTSKKSAFFCEGRSPGNFQDPQSYSHKTSC